MADIYPWQALGAYLRDARHRTAFTQHVVAHQVGISQPAYCQIERGQIRPRPALLVALAHRLGLNLLDASALAGYPLDVLVRTLVVPERPQAASRPDAASAPAISASP